MVGFGNWETSHVGTFLFGPSQGTAGALPGGEAPAGPGGRWPQGLGSVGKGSWSGHSPQAA